MGHRINLRQIEAFKAVIEHGIVSRAAEVLNISQPAVSKLLMHLESDTGLKLFDRFKGRLAPTARGLRLYEEIDRIFAGVRQVESAVEVIRREDQGQIVVGVIPALAGAFIQRATMEFLKSNPTVYCSIQSLGSHRIAESVVTRKLDVGLVSAPVENPSVITEAVLEHPLVCIMPIGHALARHDVIHPVDLDGVPFISFNVDSYTSQKVTDVLEKHDVRVNAVLNAAANPTLCQFVAAGLGVSIVHPLFIAGMEEKIAARPFEPTIRLAFQFCFTHDARNTRLKMEFIDIAKRTGDTFIPPIC